MNDLNRYLAEKSIYKIPFFETPVIENTKVEETIVDHELDEMMEEVEEGLMMASEILEEVISDFSNIIDGENLKKLKNIVKNLKQINECL